MVYKNRRTRRSRKNKLGGMKTRKHRSSLKKSIKKGQKKMMRKIYRRRVKSNKAGCRGLRARTCNKKKGCKYASGKKLSYCRRSKNVR